MRCRFAHEDVKRPRTAPEFANEERTISERAELMRMMMTTATQMHTQFVSVVGRLLPRLGHGQSEIKSSDARATASVQCAIETQREGSAMDAMQCEKRSGKREQCKPPAPSTEAKKKIPALSADERSEPPALSAEAKSELPALSEVNRQR